MNRRTGMRCLSTLVLSLLLSAAARADILIGQTAGLTGQAAASVKELNLGAKLYLDHVNASGGVGGQRIELQILDDQFDPKRSAANAQTLIDRGAVALFLTRGTPHTQAVLPLLEKHQLALVAPSTGAMLLHKPVNPHVFNVRATYQREAERAIQLLHDMGNQKVALVQVNDSFGQDAMQGALRALAERKLKPALHLSFERDKADIAGMVRQLIAAEPQLVLFVASQQVTAEAINALRAAGSRMMAATLSNNASAGFVQLLQQNAPGVVVSQVFPNERNLSLGIARELNELARKQGDVQVTPAMMEGFAAAKVLVEGLRRAGKEVSRAALLRALNGMQRYDLGGLEVSFSPGDHTGINYADISIIDPRGRFLR